MGLAGRQIGTLFYSFGSILNLCKGSKFVCVSIFSGKYI